jgi:hypothetical protein
MVYIIQGVSKITLEKKNPVIGDNDKKSDKKNVL